MSEVLDGSIPMGEAVDEVVRAWVVSLKQTEKERNLPPISGKITKDELQTAMKAVAERTSSSPSGLHYTIWKCLARDDELAEWLAQMVSMPFEFGFVNDRWTNATDVM
jgi:hypothetical protein